MRKYNGLKQVLKVAGVLLAGGMVVVAAGCAHDAMPERSDSSSGVVPKVEARDPAPPAQPELTTADLDAQLRDDAPLRYVVKRGDTLWDIAGYYLRDPWYWPQLWHDNPDIANPHLIYPGDVLVLTRGDDDQPLLTRDGDGQPPRHRGGTERLSPRVRELPVDAAVATIPLNAIRAFLTGPRLVTEDELAAAPYIVAFLDEHLLGGEGNAVYVRGADAAGPDNYSVVHPSGDYIDPETGEVLGHKAVPVGEIRIDEYDDISTGVIASSTREALTGDRLLPIETGDLVRDFYPHAPAAPIAGRIISVYDGVYTVGQYQVVTLNRGRRDGLERGHVLNVYEAGRVVRDPVEGGQVRLPENQSGQLLVFKTDERVSFAVIMRATRAIHVEDVVRSPKS